MHIQLQTAVLIIVIAQNYAETKPFRHFGMCGVNSEDKKYCIPAADCIINVEEYLRIDANRNMTNKCAQQDKVCCDRENIRNLLQTTTIPEIQFQPRFGTRAVQLLQPPACGISLVFRIYYGKETQIDEFPWTVALMYTIENGKRVSLCGATLIDKRWVITAAHCVIDKFIPDGAALTHVRLGEWNFDTNPDCETSKNNLTVCAPPYVEISIDQIIPHREFNKVTNRYGNDIALLHLSEDVVFTKFIYPLCLPLENEERNDLLTGATVDTAGWGRTEHNNSRSSIKLKAQISILPLNHCTDKYFQLGFLLENSQMCGIGINGADTCSGDSGGPIMATSYSKKQYSYNYLAGIVSYGHKQCSTPNFPAIYTRVGSYVDWIKETISSHS